MKMTAWIVPLSLVALSPLAAAAPAFARDAPSHAEKAAARYASIPFADHGGVDDWRSDGTGTVYFKDLHKQWYKARLMGVAVDLPYAERIGIIAGPGGTLDRFGGVLVEGQRYMFSSFEKVDGPPEGKAHGKHALDATRDGTSAAHAKVAAASGTR
ncbi:hypothetical protein MTR62_17670 [Novosphingobium sp. 1949]|uniref:Uncharacterized protein n=1 Tax=Novosphingobium organovorum TaxID=2930092 RepID=A0ABT0BHK4_9SPHN|nr:hypothetical protein [Novosphingobium organovorum]MCJ2184505.1 hypothetical protein [Novosphingobium organovorum]